MLMFAFHRKYIYFLNRRNDKTIINSYIHKLMMLSDLTISTFLSDELGHMRHQI